MVPLVDLSFAARGGWLWRYGESAVSPSQVDALSSQIDLGALPSPCAGWWPTAIPRRMSPASV